MFLWAVSIGLTCVLVGEFILKKLAHIVDKVIQIYIGIMETLQETTKAKEEREKKRHLSEY